MGHYTIIYSVDAKIRGFPPP